MMKRARNLPHFGEMRIVYKMLVKEADVNVLLIVELGVD
jgi:hypothetical protein